MIRGWAEQGTGGSLEQRALEVFRLAIDDAGSNGRLLDRFGNEREVVCQVVAIAAYQPNAAPRQSGAPNRFPRALAAARAALARPDID
jgi:hypothetical protein